VSVVQIHFKTKKFFFWHLSLHLRKLFNQNLVYFTIYFQFSFLRNKNLEKISDFILSLNDFIS
jgi:hypothetical protein